VERDEAIDQLPVNYGRALRLQDRGFSTHDIAVALDIPEEAIRPLLRLAEAKLARILNESPPSAEDPPSGHAD
jgi:DNA-directed RNA polymerase specialized sigma24 family protein